MSGKKNQTGSKTANCITPQIMDQIISILKSTFHGNVSLITQDGRLVQIERNEKIRPCDIASKGGNRVNSSAGKQDDSAVRAKVQEACAALEYGQVVIVIKEGKIVQIDRTEKQRFPSLMGIYGDGI
ncbi:MAG: YezD family protein [Veillonellales bacterium]